VCVCVCVCVCVRERERERINCICSTVLYLFCNEPSELLLAVQQNMNSDVQELLNPVQHNI